ncbi:MAG TPA: hypothetical protein VJ824_12095 [Bacillota bacterium]|nr:hypothetical protein [Bacillota bacterium]
MFHIPCVCPVTVQEMIVGRDMLFVVTGGAAHIGATATAYMNQGELVVEVHQLEGHKEGPLAAELARYAVERLRRTVTVVMGIHKDEATPEDIQNIVESVRAGWREMIDAMSQ